jgi:protein-L-isoaspartate(D-aspartate) O-methyltransferase
MNRLDSFRASYARLIATIGGVPADSAENSPLVEAFASVPREQFIGSAPWRIVTQSGYVTVPADDPAFLYQDFAVALQPDQHINNGQPSLHVRCLSALKIKSGEKVVHVGAGTGYYTALLAALVGASGSVIAYEVDKQLSDKAIANLKNYSNISVQNRSGVEALLPECDVIYVNAGATAPMDAWLDALRPGGRLLFPLTTTHGFGAMLLVTRKSEIEFAARFVIPCAFIHCLGARDEDTEKKLAEAFKAGGIANYQKQGGMWDVKSLRRKSQPNGTCWFAGNGWWLSTAAP